MERRFHDRWPADFEVQLTTIKNREHTASGRVTDISKSGVCVTSSTEFAQGDLVQLDIENSVLFGTIAYCRAEGTIFRTGVEVMQVLLGGTDLSKLLQATLREAIPGTPGLDPAPISM